MDLKLVNESDEEAIPLRGGPHDGGVSPLIRDRQGRPSPYMQMRVLTGMTPDGLTFRSVVYALRTEGQLNRAGDVLRERYYYEYVPPRINRMTDRGQP